MSVALVRERITVDQYEALIVRGALTENDRVELIDGEIVERAAIGGQHAGCVDDLTELIFLGLAGRATVRVQSPIRLGTTSEAEPDLTLLRRREDSYRDQHPAADAILLVVEVGDSSIDYDRNVKAPLYARSGVPELWLVDLRAQRVDVCREPGPKGYRRIRQALAGETISPLAFPDLVLEIGRFLR
jgi:Uma2 family endonuclease